MEPLSSLSSLVGQARQPEQTCLDLARWLCDLLLNNPERKPVRECYRLAARLREALPQIPDDAASLACRPPEVLARLTRPASPPPPLDFGPFALLQQSRSAEVLAGVPHAEQP